MLDYKVKIGLVPMRRNTTDRPKGTFLTWHSAEERGKRFAFGIIGFVSGVLFKKGFIRKTKASLCVFGFLMTLIVYGGIMNPASIIMWQSKITWKMIAAAYLAGFPLDLIHAFSTAFFLWFISDPMIEKLERIKIKYALLST